MIAWLAGAASAAVVEVGALAGVALSAEGTEDVFRVRPAFGLLVGLEPGPAEGLPRVELQGSSSGVGTPEGEAVTVSTWWGDLALLAGVAPPLFDLRGPRIGFDALVGPDLRLTRTAIAVYSDVERTTTATARLAVAGGPWIGAGPLRAGLRAQAYAPKGHHTQVVARIGVVF